MNVRNWRYIGSTKHAIVSVKHSPVSGNLLVSCGQEIVLIDYDVFEDKSYYFFIDEELCSIYLEKENGKFTYTFDIDEKAETPLNTARKKKNKSDILKSVAAISGVLLLFVGFLLFGRWNAFRVEAKQIANLGIHDEARIVSVSKKSKSKYEIHYAFNEDTRLQMDATTVKVQERQKPLTSFGLPVKVGDVFDIRFVPEKPEYNLINFDKPNSETINYYKTQLSTKYIAKHPDFDYLQVGCILDLLYSIDGLKAYGLFYHQDESPSVNPNFNQVTYHNLTQQSEFLAEEGICW